ncbi:MAG: InlB B-repeat-containing protein, partial [Treponema sp.]|nr:InlB B-repeat-containing protein [Treponema sp.]
MTFAFVLAGCGDADGGPGAGPTTYTVSFDVGEETPVPAQTVVSGGTATPPDPAPVKLGWVFDEWYTESTGGDIYDFSAAVTGDIILYAQWITPLQGAQKELQAAIDAAQEAVDAVGTPTVIDSWTEGTQANGNYITGSGAANTLPVGLSYVPSGFATAITTYETAIDAAQTAHDSDEADETTVNTAKSTLATATTAFNTVLANVTAGTKSLATRISGASTGTIIYLYGDEYFAGVASNVTNISGKTLTLLGVDAERTITLSSAGSMFRVGSSGGSLTLGNNVTIKGIAGNNSPLIAVTSGGTLTLQTGATIT